MLDQANLPDTRNAISSPASAFGPTPCDVQAGPIAALFGQALAPANLSARQAKEMGFLTSGIYGQLGFTSLASASLTSFLVNRLQQRTALVGSTLYKLTWKQRATPGGAVDLCAAGVGAPHIRQRLWIFAELADPMFAGRPERWPVAGDRPATGSGGACSVADSYQEQRGRGPDSQGLQPNGSPFGWEQSDRFSQPNCPTYGLDNSHDTRLEGLGGGYQTPGRGAGPLRHVAPASEFGGLADAADGPGYGSQPRGVIGELPQGPGTVQTEPRPAGPVNGHWSNADWLLCRDGKWRPVEPGTFPLANGATARVGRLRAYGNAINAEAAEAVIRAYMDCRP